MARFLVTQFKKTSGDYVGKRGEISIDLENLSMTIHDGSTPGGVGIGGSSEDIESLQNDVSNLQSAFDGIYNNVEDQGGTLIAHTGQLQALSNRSMRDFAPGYIIGSVSIPGVDAVAVLGMSLESFGFADGDSISYFTNYGPNISFEGPSVTFGITDAAGATVGDFLGASFPGVLITIVPSTSTPTQWMLKIEQTPEAARLGMVHFFESRGSELGVPEFGFGGTTDGVQPIMARERFRSTEADETIGYIDIGDTLELAEARLLSSFGFNDGDETFVLDQSGPSDFGTVFNASLSGVAVGSYVIEDASATTVGDYIQAINEITPNAELYLKYDDNAPSTPARLGWRQTAIGRDSGNWQYIYVNFATPTSGIANLGIEGHSLGATDVSQPLIAREWVADASQVRLLDGNSIQHTIATNTISISAIQGMILNEPMSVITVGSNGDYTDIPSAVTAATSLLMSQRSSVKIELLTGSVLEMMPLTVTADWSRISIGGRAEDVLEIPASHVSTTGIQTITAPFTYDVIWQLPSVTGLSVGDVVRIRGNKGTTVTGNDGYATMGAWKITNVNSGAGRITVRIQSHETVFTGGTYSTGTWVVRKQPVRVIFDQTTHGGTPLFNLIQNGVLGTINNVAFEQTGGAASAIGSSFLYVAQGSVATLDDVDVYNFGKGPNFNAWISNSGVAVRYNGVANLTNCAISQSGQNGILASDAGVISAVNCITTGNGAFADVFAFGLVSQTASVLTCTDCITAGQRIGLNVVMQGRLIFESTLGNTPWLAFASGSVNSAYADRDGLAFTRAAGTTLVGTISPTINTPGNNGGLIRRV